MVQEQARSSDTRTARRSGARCSHFRQRQRPDKDPARDRKRAARNQAGRPAPVPLSRLIGAKGGAKTPDSQGPATLGSAEPRPDALPIRVRYRPQRSLRHDAPPSGKNRGRSGTSKPPQCKKWITTIARASRPDPEEAGTRRHSPGAPGPRHQRPCALPAAAMAMMPRPLSHMPIISGMPAPPRLPHFGSHVRQPC